MAIFFKGELIPRDQISQHTEGLERFSLAKKPAPSKYSSDNPVAKIDRVTAQIHLFRTVKRDGLDRLYPVCRKCKTDNQFYTYRSVFTVDAYDLKIFLAICALGKPVFANYLHCGDDSGWKGLTCDINIVDILKFIGRRNDPDNRKRAFESLDRLRSIDVEAKIYNPVAIDSELLQYNIRETVSGSLIKIYERFGDTLLKIGLFYTVAREAWIQNDDPKYAPISQSEVQALSRNDIAIILFVFFRSDLGAGSGARYRYDDIVRLVRGEDRELPRMYPKKGVRNSQNDHHAGADRQSMSNIRAALKLIDERTEIKVFKHRDATKFIVIRPAANQ